jgi:hypothetical protein
VDVASRISAEVKQVIDKARGIEGLIRQTGQIVPRVPHHLRVVQLVNHNI